MFHAGLGDYAMSNFQIGNVEVMTTMVWSVEQMIDDGFNLPISHANLFKDIWIMGQRCCGSDWRNEKVAASRSCPLLLRRSESLARNLSPRHTFVDDERRFWAWKLSARWWNLMPRERQKKNWDWKWTVRKLIRGDLHFHLKLLNLMCQSETREFPLPKAFLFAVYPPLCLLLSNQSVGEMLNVSRRARQLVSIQSAASWRFLCAFVGGDLRRCAILLPWFRSLLLKSLSR